MSVWKVIGLGSGITVWLGCIAAHFCALQHYSAKEGAAHTPRDPDEFFAAHRQPDRPLLVMAVHPRCPCSDASLAELGDLLARSGGKCDALLVQYHPADQTSGWLADSAPQRLGGVRVEVLLDVGGKIASALGAATSGHIVFADAQGKIRFTGGLTTSRGHRGRAPAQDAILKLLSGSKTDACSAPVYGCALEPECKANRAP